MADEPVPQSESNQRIQAAFWTLLNYIDAYAGPTETEQQQYAFFESFLKEHPFRQTRRRENGWFNGEYHTPAAFMRALKDAISSHGLKPPKVRGKLINYFFKAKLLTFKPKYIRVCQEASERYRAESVIDMDSSRYDSTPARHMLGDKISPPRAESEVSSCTIVEELAHPMWKELQGTRGLRTTKRPRQESRSSQAKRRKGPQDEEPVEMPSKTALVEEFPEVQVAVPRPRNYEELLQTCRGGHKIDSMSTGEFSSRVDQQSTEAADSKSVDRRVVESRMGSAERLYSRFRRDIGDGKDDQASFDADPPASLEQLYVSAFGPDWRVVCGYLQHQRVAEIADILFALTGAALYGRILDPTSNTELASRFRSFCKEEGPHAAISLSDNDPYRGLSRKLARELSADLNEHMKHQPPRASRPDGFVSKDLEAELASALEDMLRLERAHGKDLTVRWHCPLEEFSFHSMRTGKTHATPSAETVHVYKVAMCFLPGIEKAAGPGQRSLYKAMVKVADGL